MAARANERVESTYEWIGLEDGWGESAGLITGGAVLFVFGLASAALLEPFATIGGAVFALTGAWLLRAVGTGPPGVLVDEHDDLFVLRCRGRSESIAWRSVVRFFNDDNGNCGVDLVNGSDAALPFFARGTLEAQRESEAVLVARLNALLEQRRVPHDSPEAIALPDRYRRIAPRGNRAGTVARMTFGVLLIALGVLGVVTERGAHKSLPGVAVFAGLGAVFVWLGRQRWRRAASVLVHEHDDRFVVRDPGGGSRRLAWDDVDRFRATDDGLGFADLRDGTSVRLFRARAIPIGNPRGEIRKLIDRLNTMLHERREPQDAVRPGPGD